MAQRATGFAKRSAAPDGVHAGVLVRAIEDGDAQPHAMALDLASLIAPYRKHGRLSLRVERLPPRARLSRGHNNGDRSWSLLSDELDGVAYLPPKGGPETCTLAIRIVSLDGGDGATLALIDYPITLGVDAAPPPAAVEKPSVRRADSDNVELQRLRDELARAQATLAERDTELRQSRHKGDRAEAGSSELAGARERWERELQEQLAAASALASETLERNRAAWQADQAARFTRSEERIAETRKEGETALARARAEWTTAEAARLTAAEALWQERSTKAIAEADAQLARAKTRVAAESTRERSDEAERKRLRDEISRLKKTLAARDTELADARAKSETALTQAEKKWRESEARNLAAAKAQWQDRSAHALAEATAQFERAQSRAQSEAERRHGNVEAGLETLRKELASANDAIADRESDIADMQTRLDEQAREIDSLGGQETQNQRLKGDLEAMRALAAARERELAQARTDMERARVDWRKQSDAGLAAALAQWKKDEADRVLAVESQAQEQSQVALSRMAQRLKQAEAELQQARNYAEALQKRGDSDDIKQLRREFGHLQARLAERETEVAQLRLDSEHARERWTAEARVSLQKAEHDWKTEAEEAQLRKHRAQSSRRTVRDVIFVAALSVVGVVLYQRADSGQTLFPRTLGELVASPAGTASLPPPAAAAAKQAVAPLVTIIRAANVRSRPSKTASVIATLARNTDVPSLERRGNWVRVRIETAKKPQEGWVYATYLQDKAAPTPKHR